MPVASFKRKSKVATIVPLAIVSGLWSVSLVGYNAAQANNAHNKDLPDGTSVPSSAIQAPANLPQAGTPAPAVPNGKADQVVAGAATSGIPAAALSAYQNAARIIDSADKSCNLPWELVAAIGRVESDHGRFGGNHLTKKGIATPGIFGPVLNGKSGTQLIADTDDGTVDGNKSYDRAVGPMQFIPSTWQVVKVDADNDGKRNPQDINDASLATAVYLCSGNENIAQRAGQQSAVYRYNHSHSYVNLVLRIMEAYQTGDYSSVPSNSLGGALLSPDQSNVVDQDRNNGTNPDGTNTNTNSGDDDSYGTQNGNEPRTGDEGDNGDTGTGTGSTDGDGNDNGNGNGTGNGNGNTGGSSPVNQVSKSIGDVIDTLTATEARVLCSSQLRSIPLIGTVINKAVPACASRVTGKTRAAATGIIPSTLHGVIAWLF